MRHQERHDETTLQIFIAVLWVSAFAAAGFVILRIAEHVLGMDAALAATLFYPVMGCAFVGAGWYLYRAKRPGANGMKSRFPPLD